MVNWQNILHLAHFLSVASWQYHLLLVVSYEKVFLSVVTWQNLLPVDSWDKIILTVAIWHKLLPLVTCKSNLTVATCQNFCRWPAGTKCLALCSLYKIFRE